MNVSKQNDIFTALSVKYGLHRAVIIEICTQPFKFASRRIADDADGKTIMLPYFGKFRLKRSLKGDKLTPALRGNKSKTDKFKAKYGEQGVEV